MTTTLKLLNNVKIENKINTTEKQEGFGKNRSTVDATFLIR